MNGILELQAANQVDRGGSLSAALPRDQVAAMLHELPLIIARRGHRVVGFLMTASRAMSVDVPIVRAMLTAYQGDPDAYIYGPICVDKEERGKRLAQSMFAKLRLLEAGREGILFIRRDNYASLRAHTNMGMREVARFIFDGADFAVFSYVG
ncbi:GNAT family N-acetyltransferase [Burkholderia cepacia]|uniref:hypothetical protein n=1 Tax=Burkholderia cepacia TaxID=292 RepID=UPI002AB643DD|nr:hypothetical protein [Burkholderia cepacia]